MHVLHFYFDTMTIIYSHRVGDVVRTLIVTEKAVKESWDNIRTGEKINQMTVDYDPEKPDLTLDPLEVWLVRGFRGIPVELRGKP